jgi:DmsE family decaheme c-type cytochrome
MDSLALGRRLGALALSAMVMSGHAAEPVRQRPGAAIEQDRKCLECHDEMEAKPIVAIYQTRHGAKGDARTPTCQACHGESLAHGKDRKVVGKRPSTDVPFAAAGRSLGSAAAEAQSRPCLQCHESNTARDWWGSSHENRGLACPSCHTLHTPRDRLLERSSEAETCYACHPAVRAQTYRPSAHPIAAGKLACRDCHAVHGGDGPRLTRHAAINDTCHECHADKRGPFLWEHAPVNDNCLNCHAPHGSSHGGLLKARQPWLCQQCHSSTRHPSVAYSGAQIPGGSGALAAQIPLRGCGNCHSRVHGSNHPSGARLLR